ncbi:RAM signaling pathway, SOG2 [Drechmeria coniospora]|uniref:RAM signaling pathway, SOG2 n=1 Tax=Drechmeria coniospora TaxID=98403 RepID=A0A151GVT4_DRECN|nr:RAM signaling pathway, SOG2 [Drechmeria coniospora]KYK61214.1 RAM signaling pathway, SOG2 [Drechmeria coniospora]
MDRFDRMPGSSVQSSALRSLPENAALGRRPVPNSAATSNGPSPILSHRDAQSNASLSASSASHSIAPSQVIALAREAMQHAIENEKGQAAEVGAVGTPGLRSGVTIDLSRKNIQRLPEEVVDIVKEELERLALSHNQLSTLPARFAECTSLRYLNIRGNQIKEFPLPLCELKSLEILDLGRNQLRVLPNEISNLVSLKVLSVPKNQIGELPLCIAEMASLQVLKFEGNPISFPPKDVIQPQAGSPSFDGFARDTELTEVAVTAHIRKFLKQYAALGRSDLDGTGDELSEGADTPRFPLKRVASGRFPIRINGADVADMRPANGVLRQPAMTSRSHSRGLSQQSLASRRPGVMPLTIGSVSERLRSNSESLLRADRHDGRSRRMGMVTKKTSDLGTLEESDVNVRFSHYRGLSHGSAMQGATPAAKSPATPTDVYLQRPVYIRRLSVLPERRRESKVFDPIAEAAKGILYSVFQIHPMIQALMTLSNDEPAKRSSLEIVFYNTNSHVQELEQAIQKHDAATAYGADHEEHSPRDGGNVHSACQTLVSAYRHVCSLLTDNIDTFVDNGDARYIRTLLMLLYNSIMELRVTLAAVTRYAAKAGRTDADAESTNNTIRPYHREPSAATLSVADERSGLARHRNGSSAVPSPVPLQVVTDGTVPYTNGTGRTATGTVKLATPRSGDSFTSVHAHDMVADYSAEDDALFDRIYLSLQRSADVVLRSLPSFQVQLAGGLRNAVTTGAHPNAIQHWRSLASTCSAMVQQTEALRNRLSLIKLKDPAVRLQASFWNQISSFVGSWTNLGSQVKAAINSLPLPQDTKYRLRPIQQSMKETTDAILQSPWHQLFQPPRGHGSISSDGFSPTCTSPTQGQVPITPLSAALGPAMQATVSAAPTATPHSTSFAAAFHGNVFDRADALIANPGISMSRTGATTRGHSGFNSLSSISSMSSDGNTTPGPPTAFNPNNGLGLLPPRMNGGRVAI